jgi:hypothetical protein
MQDSIIQRKTPFNLVGIQIVTFTYIGDIGLEDARQPAAYECTILLCGGGSGVMRLGNLTATEHK